MILWETCCFNKLILTLCEHLSPRCDPLLVINAVVTLKSIHTHTHTCGLTSRHPLWQLFVLGYIMNSFNCGPALAWLLSDTEAYWCTVTVVNTSFSLSVSVSHSLKNTKEHSVFDGSTVTSVCSCFFLSCKNVRHAAQGPLFSFSLAPLFFVSCHVFQPPPPTNIFLVFHVFFPTFNFHCGFCHPCFQPWLQRFL